MAARSKVRVENDESFKIGILPPSMKKMNQPQRNSRRFIRLDEYHKDVGLRYS